MAISVRVIHDVRSGGSDTLNAGMFDPSATAGMNTNGAATSANTASPVFSSAAYNFAASDVGAWLFLAAGTNVIRGWYQIASVAGGAATLSAAIGSAVLFELTTPSRTNVIDGCASVASPTSITWTIDYSQQNTAQIAYTDLASTGTGLTVSSAANPFGRHQVGNGLIIISGTNFNPNTYIITSVSVGLVATVAGPGNITTGVGASGVGGLGGAMATPGKAVGQRNSSNKVFLEFGTYTCTTATPNVSGGIIQMNTSDSSDLPGVFMGWSGMRTYDNTGSRPEINAGALTNVALITTNGQQIVTKNLILDCKGNGNTTGFSMTGNAQVITDIWVKNSTANGFSLGSVSMYGLRLRASGFSGTAGFTVSSTNGILDYCEADTGTTTGFNSTNGHFFFCIARDCTGASKCGWTLGGTTYLENCVAVGCTSHGALITGTGIGRIRNFIAEGNGGYGISSTTNSPLVSIENYGNYNNTSGAYNSATLFAPVNLITATGSFFTNAAAGDMSLNSTINQGLLAQGTGITVLPALLTTSYNDLGAAQHLATGGGGAVNPFNGVIVSR